MSKKLEQKQARREAEQRRAAEQKKAALKRNALTIGTALLVTAIVVVAIWFQKEDAEAPGGSENVGVAAAQAGCEEIEEFEAPEENPHVEPGAPHEPYNSSPPTTGPMYEQTAPLGFSTEALPEESLVHNQEHGAIVIWYQPDAPAETISAIENLTLQEPQATVAAPYTDIEAPYQLVISAWGALQRCEQVSQEVVDDFRREYQGNSPEKITPPFEG